MKRYEGLEGKQDEIVGGGKYVKEHGYGGEVCNFLKCADGFVYGHVETSKSGNDREINLDALDASPGAEHVEGITVVWTATHPSEGGRRIIGWYKNASVWRKRQDFQKKAPSKQHEADELKNFRIRARANNAYLLPEGNRILKLKSGEGGWMGITPWWFPDSQNSEIRQFIQEVEKLIDGDDELIETEKIMASKTLNLTQKKALLDARIGQGQFRKALLHEWRGCAVMGCEVPELLRASHIKPWSISNNRERLDPNNGLLLIASLDAAFEHGLVTFSDVGHILISPELSEQDKRTLAITNRSSLRMPPSKARQRYLTWHREEKFRD